MNPRNNSQLSTEELDKLESYGYINDFIQVAVQLLNKNLLFKSELKKRIINCLKNHYDLISNASIKQLRKISDKDIANLIEPYSPPNNSIGTIEFPVVATDGLIRKISVFEQNNEPLKDEQTEIIDRIGSTVFSFISKKSGLSLFWDSNKYSFSILDHKNKEDTDVHGESMGLALAIALYSLITNTPIPIEFSAIAHVKRDGKIEPVESIHRKLKIISKERDYIKKIVISSKQKKTDKNYGIQVVRVNNLDETLALIFPIPTNLNEINVSISIEDEYRKIEKQYHSYLLNSCMQNIDQLIKYMNSEKCDLEDDVIVNWLFHCLKLLASCHCHQGSLDIGLRYFEEAKNLFHLYDGDIETKDYWHLQNFFGVALKDLFKYHEAKKIHYKIDSELKRIGSNKHEIGVNLSSLSQLYVAQNNFEKAILLQKEAIEKIRSNELHRNYNYLSQFYMRAGNYEDAQKNIDIAKTKLKKVTKNQKSDLAFIEWTHSELLYRKGLNRRKRSDNFNQLGTIASRYKDINWYVDALINKFFGLSLLINNNPTADNVLDEVIHYFEKEEKKPIFKIMSVSVRSERAIILIDQQRFYFAQKDIFKIINILKLTKNFTDYFEEDHFHLATVYNQQNGLYKNSDKVINILTSIKSKIPY